MLIKTSIYNVSENHRLAILLDISGSWPSIAKLGLSPFLSPMLGFLSLVKLCSGNSKEDIISRKSKPTNLLLLNKLYDIVYMIFGLVYSLKLILQKLSIQPLTISLLDLLFFLLFFFFFSTMSSLFSRALEELFKIIKLCAR